MDERETGKGVVSGFAGLGRWIARTAARIRARLSGRRAAESEELATRALEELEHALAESDAEQRLLGLRQALAIGERLNGERGDQIVLEASLHLG